MPKEDHDSLSKLLQLYDQLQLGGSIHSRRTAEVMNVHRRTIQRYVSKLAGAGVELEPEILPDGSQRYSIPQARRLFVSKLPAQQVFALHVALGWLRQFEDSVLFESLDGLRQRIGDWLEGRLAKEAKLWETQKFLALPFLPFQYDVNEDVLNDVVTALLRVRKLKFRYETAEGERRTHLVRPYTLLYTKGAFYLVALVDHARPGYRPTTFHLSRMTRSEVQKAAPYEYPADWDPRTMAPSKSGLLGGEEEDLEVIFDAKFHRHLAKERIWPAGTKIKREGDRVRFRTRLPLSDELLVWLMGFTPPVEIISPPEFRERLLDRAREILDQHSPRT